MSITVKPSALKAAIRQIWKCNLAPFVWGPPGIGKSQIIHELAMEEGFQFYDLRGPTMDPVDVRGLPFNVVPPADDPSAVVTYWGRASFLKTEGDWCLLLDEMNSAPVSVQVAFYQLILDRRIGEHMLGDGVRMVAAGNRVTDQGAAVKMPTPLSNRLIHLELEVDLDDWCNWAVNEIQPEIIAFMRFRPNLLHNFDPAQRAFPTPRSWAFASKLIQDCPKTVEYALLAGAVGEGAATECKAYLDMYRKLPDLDDLIKDPKNSFLPKNDPGVSYAVAYGLAHRATKTNLKNVITYLERMPPEYAVLSMKAAINRDKKLAENSPEFRDWAAKNAHALKGE